MPFRFVKESAVVVGTFNIYVIQPGWLKEVGLLDESVSGVMLETDLSQPGFKMEVAGTVWHVEPTRIVLESSQKGKDLGATLNTIFDKLPWTPLRAVGFNAEYAVEPEEVPSITERWTHPAPTVTMEEGDLLAGFGWGAMVTHDDHQYSLSLAKHKGAVRLTLNVHTELAGREIDFAKETVSRYLFHQKKAIALSTLLFQVTTDDIPDS